MGRLKSVLVLLGMAGMQYGLAQTSSDPVAPQPLPCGLVTSVARPYSLKLVSFAPTPDQLSGLLLQARFNGGPPLRLLLDSGAAHITLDARASSRSNIFAVLEAHLVGVGEYPRDPVRSGVASTIDVGSLEFRNCQVDITPHELGEGIDGVIPMSLFRSFLVRLDLPGKVMDLVPYSDRGAVPPAGFASATLRDDLLFVRGALNNLLQGHILIDTGACYSAISLATAQVLRASRASAVSLRGANGVFNGDLIGAGIRFDLAGRSITTERVVAVDLSAFSAFNGVDTIGVLGYPALRYSVLTVNYRDALLRIETRPKRGSGLALMADERKAGAN